MPNTTQVIFLKKANKFELRSDIQSFWYDQRRGQYHVVFKDRENVVHYSPDKVDVAEFTRQLDPPLRVIRKSDGDVFHHVLGVRVFESRLNKAYRVLYENGKATNYQADYLSIEEHIDDYRSISVWEYLNEVARYNVIPVDEKEDKTVSLGDKYKKMEFAEKNSLLEAYLNVNTYHKETVPSSNPIFPFGCNRSQYKAVCNALENKLSVIQGPPGTGKTQTILNILANLLLSGKTMQIVSNNNSAVENVKEKLEAVGLGFLCAQLGKASNKEEFITSQTGIFPDILSWKSDTPERIRTEAIHLSKELQRLYEYQEELAICSEKLEEYKRQLELFPNRTEIKKQFPTYLLEKFFLVCNRELENKNRLSWWTRIRLMINHLPYDNEAPDKLHYMLVMSRIRHLEKHSSMCKEVVKDLDVKNKRLQEVSMCVLKHHLFKLFRGRTIRPLFNKDEIYLKSQLFLKQYPIVLSTTFSATSNINPVYKFDYLIMDEASQVDIAAGALALSCANNAVIVGDLKQLPNVVDNHTEEIVSAIFAKYGISEAYRYSTNSFLSSVCKLYPNIPQVLLKEHYRCNPLIIGFCSKQFYGGELIPMKKDNSNYAPIRVVRTVMGNHARGTVNYRQVASIVQEIIPALEEQFTDIGIIAPYNKQVNAINEELHKLGKEYVVATVHKFQGRENDAIVLSTVDNQVSEFTDDPHLLNVAVSRAKKQFTLVVSSDEQPDSNIQDLIDYIEYYQGKSEQSKISSVFDVLYEGYANKLLEFYKTHKRVSQYHSENLVYWTISDILKENNANLGVLMHYPLRHLITAASDITDDQRKYAMNSWTHLDFLIYDTVSHKAKLAIEVDGTQYHKEGSIQHQRDEKKDAILKSIRLPILRLSTAGSQERERIATAIKSSL